MRALFVTRRSIHEQDKELLQNLLSSITEEVKSEKEQKQLVYDVVAPSLHHASFTTIMMDPDVKQLFLSLNDALPANYCISASPT